MKITYTYSVEFHNGFWHVMRNTYTDRQLTRKRPYFSLKASKFPDAYQLCCAEARRLRHDHPEL
jgi:hypothetical protein